MSNRLANILAVSLLLFVFAVCVFSLKDDSLTMDELAHLPAGYSYLTQKDMRLNPEHPPLVKDLAAIPLLFFQNINFQTSDPAWQDDVNGQWDFGYRFLFYSGNPTDQMIFRGRIPMVLLLLVLGFFIFKLAREFWGTGPALLSLFLFSFSPTLLAHGRLVTTDVGAAFSVLLATYYFLKFLRRPSPKGLLLAGFSLGLAWLTKFSTFLLLPFFGFILLVWVLIKISDRSLVKNLLVYALKFMIVVAIAAAVVWLVYEYHVWNYPAERQARDASLILASHPIQSLREIIPSLVRNPVWRPWAQYLLGLSMVLQRGASGNTTYFLGEVSASGWKNYFPVVYAIKEPLAFFALLFIGVVAAACWLKKPFWQEPFSRLRSWLGAHFVEFSFSVFIGLYWLTSLVGSLNIGVRHLLPVFPFTILLVSRLTFVWFKPPFLKLKTFFLAFLLAWQAFSVLHVFPSFLAYFNELAGGPNNGYVYVVDSNLDWGQDLKRLNFWLEKQEIDKIYVDYFGGSDTRHYLGSKYLQWWSSRQAQEMTETPYLAVSATFLQGQRGEPVKGFTDSYGQYRWLDRQKLVAKIGYSLFVYKVEN